MKPYLTTEGNKLPVTPAVQRQWIAEDIGTRFAHSIECVDIDWHVESLADLCGETLPYVVYHSIGRGSNTQIELGAKL